MRISLYYGALAISWLQDGRYPALTPAPDRHLPVYRHIIFDWQVVPVQPGLSHSVSLDRLYRTVCSVREPMLCLPNTKSHSYFSFVI
jgi:hypothetical protein